MIDWKSRLAEAGIHDTELEDDIIIAMHEMEQAKNRAAIKIVTLIKIYAEKHDLDFEQMVNTITAVMAQTTIH